MGTCSTLKVENEWCPPKRLAPLKYTTVIFPSDSQPICASFDAYSQGILAQESQRVDGVEASLIVQAPPASPIRSISGLELALQKFVDMFADG